MNSNVFIWKNLKKEDHFTRSMAHMLNLFPRELGDRLLQKIARLSGLEEKSLGQFKSAEFSGFDFQSEESTSKLDMVIHTNKRPIFFEHKLDAPLSNRQLERHLDDVKRKHGKLVFVSNVQTRISAEVKSQRHYLKPRDQDHFVWANLEPVFKLDTRKGTFANNLLIDFRSALRINGMRGREIAGAEGSLYTPGFPAQELALNQYQAKLRELGWKASRRPTEHTLRVNPERTGLDPIFNPRFFATGEWLDPNFDNECDVIFCYAKQEFKAIRTKLRKLSSLTKKYPEVRFVPYFPGLYRVGYVYIPLKFIKAKGGDRIDWDYKMEIWEEMRRILNGK